MKNLILAGLISLSAICAIAPQAQAGQKTTGLWGHAEDTLCVSDRDYLWTYGSSDLCANGYGYSLYTQHSDTTTSISVRSPQGNTFRGGTLRMALIEIGEIGVAHIEIDPDGNVRVEGDRAMADRYRIEVDIMAQAMEDFDGFDLAQFADQRLNSSFFGE